MSKYLIVGCGYVGKRVAKHLIQSGAEVTAITRSSTDFPLGAQGINLELGKGRLEQLGAFDGILFALAATSGDEAGYKQAYVDSLKEVYENTQSDKFIFISSTSVYPRESLEVLTEESPAKPDSFRGEILLEGEAIVPNAHIVRAGGIYGPGRMRYLAETDSSQYQKVVHRIHVEDLANFCSRALLTSGIAPGIYNLVDSKPATGGEIIDWIQGRPAKTYPQASRIISNEKLLSCFTLEYPDFTYGYGEALKDIRS